MTTTIKDYLNWIIEQYPESIEKEQYDQDLRFLAGNAHGKRELAKSIIEMIESIENDCK